MLETLLEPGDTIERCGLILHDGQIVEIENIAEDPTRSYRMKPSAVLPYLETETIAGTWHTHPDGSPNLSGEDHSGFLNWPDMEHSIVGIRDGKVLVVRYRLEDGIVITCD